MVAIVIIGAGVDIICPGRGNVKMINYVAVRVVIIYIAGAHITTYGG